MSNPFPDLAPDEYDALLADIEQRGIVYPIIRDQLGRTIDGHQREHIAATLGIDAPAKVINVDSDAEREALAIALNVHRRQLTPAQKREYIIRLDPAVTQLSQREVARAVDVAQSTVSKTLSAARGEGVIPRNNSGTNAIQLPATKAQQRSGKAPDAKRGGRPSSAGNRGQKPATHGRKRPTWLRDFNRWCKWTRPEDRALLLDMDARLHEAMALNEVECEHSK